MWPITYTKIEHILALAFVVRLNIINIILNCQFCKDIFSIFLSHFITLLMNSVNWLHIQENNA